MRRFDISAALAGLSFAAVGNAASTATASVTPTAAAASASGISQVIAPEYAGFGIEPSNMFSFTGEEDANDFTVNLMANLGNYSGKPGHVRIGGNTQDYFLYQVDMTEWEVATNDNSVGSGTIASDSDIIGPKFFEAVSRFPAGTPITFGLNLAYDEDDYVDQIVLMASAALNNLSNVDLVSFEIGNEPDLYGDNGFRTGTWDGSTYVDEWKERAKAVWEQVLEPAGGWSINAFEGPCTASTIGTTFEISQLVDDGIQANADSTSNPYIRGWNQHDYLYFVDVSTTVLTLDWMTTLSNTESQFEYWATQVGIALDTGLPYYLREMQSVGPTGVHNVSDTFGASLWALNFFLYAASLNISSVEMHMTDNSYAAPWQPITRNGVAPNVRPVYYAYAAMAQLIGSGNGTTRVAPLSTDGVPDDYTDYVRMYAGYANDELSSVVLINTMQANSSESDKNTLNFIISLPDYKGETLYLSYLSAEGAEVTSNTTWNGLSYEESGDGTPTTADTTAHTVTIDSSSGKATVSVRDSQAVIANIGSLLGSNDVSINSTSNAASKSSASASAGASKTAAVAAAATTTLALASSLSGSAATATSTQQSSAAPGSRQERSWSGLLIAAACVGLVAVCYVW